MTVCMWCPGEAYLRVDKTGFDTEIGQVGCSSSHVAVCLCVCIPSRLSVSSHPSYCLRVACLRIRQAAALIQSVETGREGLFEGQIYLFTKTIIAITIVVRRQPSCRAWPLDVAVHP